MSYEDTIKEIENEIQDFNRDTAIEAMQNPGIMKDPETFQRESTYLKRRKEAAEKIYSILLSAFECMEKRAEELETENASLKKDNVEFSKQIEYWKEKYKNKIFAND